MGRGGKLVGGGGTRDRVMRGSEQNQNILPIYENEMWNQLHGYKTHVNKNLGNTYVIFCILSLNWLTTGAEEMTQQ